MGTKKIEWRYNFIYLLFLLLFHLTLLSSLVWAENGQLVGQVTPVEANPTVYAISPEDEIAGVAAVGVDGGFTLSLPMGIYDLFIVVQDDYNNKSIFQIGVNEGEIVVVPEIVLSQVGETGTISGYSKPIVEGARIYIKRFGYVNIEQESIIGSDGSFQFTNLDPDTYGIFVQFNATSEFYPYKWGMIAVYANTSLTGLNLTFTPKTYKYLIDRILVRFQPDVTENERETIVNSFNSSIISHYTSSSLYVVSVPNGKTVDEMIDAFKTRSEVKDAYPEGIAHTTSLTKSTNVQNDEEELSFAQWQDKINHLKAIVEKNQQLNSVEIAHTNEPKDEQAVVPLKNYRFYSIMLVILIVIFISYFVIKWKKRS